MSGGVTLECAGDYGRRCEAIGKERQTTEDLQHAMNHPDFKKRHHLLLDELVAQHRLSLPLLERPVWKSVQLGTHPSVDELRETLTDAGINVSNWANDILGKVEVASEPQEVNLVIATVAELGFPDGATREQIYTRALELGLELCPAEVGPALRLQYADQPEGEWLRIAMEPIAHSDGHLRVFRVAPGSDGLWLYGHNGHPGSFWDGAYRWVFCRK